MNKNKKKEKLVVELKTNSQGWIRVLLLKMAKGCYVLKLPSGDIIKKRNSKHLKFGKTKKIKSIYSASPNILRHLKTKKRKKRYIKKENFKKPFNKKTYKNKKKDD